MAIGLTKVSTAEMRTMPKGIGVRARHWMPALRLGWCLPLRCLACVCGSRCGTASLRQTTQNTPRHPSALLQVDNLHYLNDGERGCRGAQQSVGSGSLGSKCCSSGREALLSGPPTLSSTAVPHHFYPHVQGYGGTISDDGATDRGEGAGRRGQSVSPCLLADLMRERNSVQLPGRVAGLLETHKL